MILQTFSLRFYLKKLRSSGTYLLPPKKIRMKEEVKQRRAKCRGRGQGQNRRAKTRARARARAKPQTNILPNIYVSFGPTETIFIEGSNLRPPSSQPSSREVQKQVKLNFHNLHASFQVYFFPSVIFFNILSGKNCFTNQ